MKRLLLLRHAKSDWDAPASDHERPLNQRGCKAADRMGRFVARTGPTPDRIVTSSALRARDTAARVTRAGGFDVEIFETSDLYSSGPAAVLRVVSEQDDGVETLMVVGHEPTWSELLSGLVGEAAVRFPTAALARIDFAVSHWRDVAFGTGQLCWFVTPKLLARDGSADA